MIILRCIGPEQFFLERVVFPFELLTFHCPARSKVEIWTHGLGGPELLESIEARELVVESAPMPEPVAGGMEANPWLQAGCVGRDGAADDANLEAGELPKPEPRS